MKEEFTAHDMATAAADGFRNGQKAAQSAPAGERETIRAVFLRNGFTIKEGQTDLKPYVYDAAHELLSIARAHSMQAAGSDVEEVEVVAWQDADNPMYTTAERRVMLDWVNNDYPITPLMTVAQHERIVEQRLDNARYNALAQDKLILALNEQVAALSAQQSAPKAPEVRERPRYVCRKCKQETRPPEPYKAYVLCDCGYMTAATTALAPSARQEVVEVGVPDGFLDFASIAKQCLDDEAATWVGDNKDAARLALDDAYMRILIALASPAAPTVKAEQVQCNCPGGSKPGPASHAPNCPVRSGEPSPALPVAGSAVEDVEVVGINHGVILPERKSVLYGFDGQRTYALGWNACLSEVSSLNQHNRIVAALSAQQSDQDEAYPPCDYCGVVPDYHPWHGSGAFRGVENPHIHACNDCRHLLPTAQPAPERVSVLCEALEDARRAMFAVLNQEPRMKAVAKRVLNAEIDRIDRALLASHAEGGKV